MNPRILAIEVRDELYAIIREPAAVFFAIAMPVGFFALFASLFSAESTGSGLSVPTQMLATFGTFGVVGVTLLNPGIGVAEDRERGWLRVKRASPVPVVTTLVAKVAAALPVALAVFVAMSLTAVALGQFDTGLATWLQLAGVLLLGSLPFALLGLAVGFVTSGRAAPAVLNAVFIPSVIAAGLWMPLEILPGFVQRIAPFLPTYHLGQLGMGMLLGERVLDHVAALLLTTVVAALAAGAAYRSARM
jgi:ABC-2 type transport system permease protein